MNALDKSMKDAENFIAKLDEVISIPEVQKPLPIPVQRFCADITKTFEITAVNLEKVAAKLEAAAAELRSRAHDLRDAAPDVRGHVERWIAFERESSDRSQFLNTLFEKK